VANLEFELQTAATNLEVMLGAQTAAGKSSSRGKPRSLGRLVDLKASNVRKLTHSTQESAIEIIPLIDIMFFLLASFMIGELSQVHMKGVKVNLPSAFRWTQTKREYPVYRSIKMVIISSTRRSR